MKALAYKLWRRMWGKDWLTQEIRLLGAKRLPWRIWCWTTSHDWDESSFSIGDGPISVHPRERHYWVIHRTHQCKRCYDMEQVPYSEEEGRAAIEDAIVEDEAEWPEVMKILGAKS